jgi:eukaryotic-like serine/threonine-protein kinase
MFPTVPQQTQMSSKGRCLPLGEVASLDAYSTTTDPELTGSRYQLGLLLARGGMAAVYEGHDTLLNRPVAIKIIHESLDNVQNLKRFHDEAIITGNLQHPSIPPIYDIGTLADGRPFLAMKLIQGRTLADFFKTDGHGSKRWLSAFEAICQAVGFAHRQGYIHRDLKPQNIMIAEFGEVKVMDWGLAKKLVDQPEPSTRVPVENPDVATPTELPSGFHQPVCLASLPSTSQVTWLNGRSPVSSNPERPTGRSFRDHSFDPTQAGSVLGTPSYMSPEQARGQVGAIDERTDVFALGAILCELLTAAPPLEGEGTEVVASCAAGLFGPALERLDGSGEDPVLIAVAKQCLAVNPNDRPTDAVEVATRIAHFRAEADTRAKELERKQTQAAILQSEVIKRRRVWSLCVATVILVLSGGVAISLLQLQRVRNAELATTVQLLETNQQKERAEAQQKLAVAEKLRAEAAESQAKQNESKAVQLARETERSIDILFTVLKDIDVHRVKANGTTLEALLADRLVQASQHLNAETISDATKRTDMHLRIATTLMNLERYNDALPLLKNDWESKKRAFGPDDSATLKSELDFAICTFSSVMTKESISSLQALIPKLKEHLGKDDPVTLRAMYQLGTEYRLLGLLHLAKPPLEEALELTTARYGNDHILTAECINHLALVYRSSGMISKAASLFEQSIALSTAKLGADHPDTMNHMGSLGACYLILKKYDKAAAIWEVVLPWYKARLGPEHPNTIQILENTAITLVQCDRGPEAAHYFEELVRVQRVLVKPRDQQNFAGILANVGWHLMMAEEYRAAEKYLRESLAIRRQIDPDDWKCHNAKSLLGNALLAQNKNVEAEPLLTNGYQGLLQQRAKIPWNGQANLFRAGDRLIELYTKTKRPERAKAVRSALPMEVAPRPQEVRP